MFPNLFKIGPFTLHSYGLLLAVAFLVGLKIAAHYGKKEGIESSRIFDLVLYIFLSALLGAKILHVIVDFRYYSEDWNRLLDLYQVGGVFYGGLIFAIGIALWYVRRHRLPFWQTVDAVVMGLPIGQMFGRLGCFLAGCCWGKPAGLSFPLAVTFRKAEAAEQVGTPLNIPLHPTQLYEAVLLLGIFVALFFAYRRKQFHGQQLMLYLLLYSIARFSVEFFRGDPRGTVLDGLLSTSQFISVLMFLGAVMIFFLRKRVRTAPA